MKKEMRILRVNIEKLRSRNQCPNIAYIHPSSSSVFSTGHLDCKIAFPFFILFSYINSLKSNISHNPLKILKKKKKLKTKNIYSAWFTVYFPPKNFNFVKEKV